jgi:cytochrome c-type biogenesis protein CcmH/NrfG
VISPPFGNGEYGMDNEASTASFARPSLQARQVYTLAVVCLVLGLAIGYLLGGSQAPVLATHSTANIKPSTPSPHAMNPGHMPTMGEMKHMADKQSAPLLEKLKNDPNNTDLLAQLGAVYHTTHQFKEAAGYYEKAVQADPRNVAMRTNLGMIKLQGKGDGKGAVAAWQKLLKLNPQLSPDRKATVQKLMAEVMTSLEEQRPGQGVRQQ